MDTQLVATVPPVSTQAIAISAAGLSLHHAPYKGVPSEYLNSREAAAYLHVKYRTLLEWVRLGILPGIPLGCGTQRKTWLFLKSAIDEHLREMMTGNSPRSNRETVYVN
jgi:excisionase family DNA binding protein